VITVHPLGGSMRVGGNYTLSCSAEGQGTLKHIWQKQESTRWIKILSTEDSSSYTTSNCGTYRCVVSNGAGSVESNSAKITIEGECGELNDFLI